jgi:hypothetical protein
MWKKQVTSQKLTWFRTVNRQEYEESCLCPIQTITRNSPGETEETSNCFRQDSKRRRQDFMNTRLKFDFWPKKSWSPEIYRSVAQFSLFLHESWRWQRTEWYIVFWRTLLKRKPGKQVLNACWNALIHIKSNTVTIQRSFKDYSFILI